MRLNVEHEVVSILESVLGLGPRAAKLTSATALLGSMAEVDSMAVVAILTALEERFDIAVDDDEVDGRTFATVGSLAEFVRSKLGA